MDDLSDRRLTRRRFLQLAGIGVFGLGVEACARVAAPALNSGAPVAGSTPATGIAPTAAAPGAIAGVNGGKGAPAQTPAAPGQVAITSNKDFYTVYYRTGTSDLPGQWQLELAGNIDKPLKLTLDDIQAMPAVEEMRTLECISNPAGGPLISNANWKGIRMKDLLQRVGVKPGTVELKLESFDGYSTAIPLALAMDEHSLLVYEMNGEPLPLEHGKPLRCLWPGRYGMKQPKWLTKITAVTEPYAGFWEGQGWSDDAFIQPSSRIDAPAEDAVVRPGTLEMSGIGFSGAAGIARIEVSADEGKTWHEANLVRGPTPYVWTNWSWSGQTPPEGEATLLARVTDNTGKAQTPPSHSLLGDTFPNGTSAMQPVLVIVKKG